MVIRKTYLAFLDIQCDSVEFAKTLCAAGGTVEDVALKRQDSSTTCTKGETFGWEGSNIWADKGCRGNFIVAISGKSFL